MPREARNKINGKFYHVMSQGINREEIFHKEEYKKIYIKLIFEYAKKYNIKIIAYCIMTNHAHLLLEISNTEEMSKFMKLVNMKFAMLYNHIESRVGIVFRNRFKSEFIYDEKYFYNCVQYIHNNPVKAGIVKKQKDYKFSSANNYNLEKILSQIQKSYNIQDNQEIYCIDTEEDRKIILEIEMQKIIKKFKEKYSLTEFNINNKGILKLLVITMKKTTNANNAEIAKVLRNF